jgi:hypothetical protein
MVSGTISLPCSGYFSPFPHGTGSLSVSQEYLALPDGTGWFTQDFSGPALLRILAGNTTLLRVPGFHRLRLTFPGNSTIKSYCVSQVLQPPWCRNTIGLGCSTFARHYLQNHYCFLLLRLMRCFSSAGLPPKLLRDIPDFSRMGCPIRTPADRKLFAPPRSFSQLVTSFFASESLGIHHTPLLYFLLLVTLYIIYSIATVI